MKQKAIYEMNDRELLQAQVTNGRFQNEKLAAINGKLLFFVIVLIFILFAALLQTCATMGLAASESDFETEYVDIFDPGRTFDKPIQVLSVDGKSEPLRNRQGDKVRTILEAVWELEEQGYHIYMQYQTSNSTGIGISQENHFIFKKVEK